MKVKRKILHSILICLYALTFVALLKGYGLRHNMSPSLPYTLFFSKPVTSPKLNQIVSFSHQATSVIFAKIIAGIPGDHIRVYDHKIYINGVEKGSIQKGIEPISTGTIPDGFYFVMGLHPESFDSRYEEFGLVPRNAIRESLCPIF